MIRAYIDMVRWEDHLRDHPFYSRMALSAVKAYLLLHDQPDLAHGPLPGGMNGSGGGSGDSAERKKALKKAKREQQKLEKAEAEKREAKKISGTAKGTDGETKKEDTDPLGTKLVQTQEPLKDAMKFLTPLLEHSPGNIETQVAGFEVYLRRKKYLLALKCLLAAHAIDSSNPILHVQLVRFRRALDSISEPLPSKVSEIVANRFEALLPQSLDLLEWNDSFLASYKASVSHVQAFLNVQLLLNPDSRSESEKDLLSTLDLENVSVSDAIDGLELLTEWGSDQTVRMAFIEKASTRWNEAPAFKST